MTILTLPSKDTVNKAPPMLNSVPVIKCPCSARSKSGVARMPSLVCGTDTSVGAGGAAERWGCGGVGLWGSGAVGL